jgi:predicted lipoprotein with Yx(FWY)xxD motif
VALGLAALIAGTYAAIALREAAPGPPAAPLATPPGVTLQSSRRGGRAEEFTANVTILFADANGMTLYSFDRESGSDRLDCTGDCAKDWRPAMAPAGAAPDGDWSLAPLPGGQWQWRLRGRRLYRYAGDAAPGDAKGDGVDSVWHKALFQPANLTLLPLGIGLRELANGGGEAFVDNGGMTLYIPDDAQASRTADDPCRAAWRPAAAPEIANRVGDFAAIARQDGIRQWSWKGWPLFRFDGDLAPDDANGAGCAGFRVALLRRFFMPPGVAVRHHPGLGDILTTLDGRTLYARDRFIDVDGHNFRTDHGSAATGRALGAASCEADCLRDWRPLAAPAGAVAQGYWDVLTRPDGTRQWAYKGYALYSYAGDRAPGDVTGNELYALAPLGQDEPQPAGAPAARPGAGLGALFWRAATP